MSLEFLILALVLVCAVLLVLLLLGYGRPARQNDSALLAALEKQTARQAAELQALRTELNAVLAETMRATGNDLQNSVARMATLLGDSQRQSQLNQSAQMSQLGKSLAAQQNSIGTATLQHLTLLDNRMKQLESSTETRLNALRDSQAQSSSALRDSQEKSAAETRAALEKSLQELRAENSRKLEEMRRTVDEKLQETLDRRISESFRTVSTQLEQVYKGLGEMQNLAADVGGLKKVLSGVKSRGILGEYQLGAILQEILTPEQYDMNVPTIPGSSERVEFAVRLPGSGEGEVVYLPIDSKFPGDAFAHLQDALAAGNAEAAAAARRDLRAVLRSEAKDIAAKYVEPPYTTAFGVMFLPFEGLYAEAVNMGLLEEFQRDLHINIAGPSTMAALLNSLQMGFRTLAIQKRSSEVWQTLGAVKTEFGKFRDVLVKMKLHLQQTDRDLDLLLNTRTNGINRRLRAVQALDSAESARLLALEDSPEDENT